MDEHLSDKVRQLKCLKSGKGVQYILDAAYKILGNPLLIHDMDYKLIAYNKNAVNDDPIWNEFVTNGTVDLNRLLFYKDETFFDMAAYAENITFMPSDRLKYDRVYGKLFTNGQIPVGCAAIVACNKPFESSDTELFRIVCDILNAELMDSEYYQNYGQAYMETLIAKLIDDSIEDKKLYAAHIANTYIGLGNHLRLAVVDFSASGIGSSQFAHFRDLCKRILPAYRYIIYSNNIIILMGADRENFRTNHGGLHKLYQLFEQYDMYAGISSRFEKSYELRKYFLEAVDALCFGMETNIRQRIFIYDEVCKKPL